ncbi:response regulator transcription factor [Paenibacillus ginsengarvi]|uniref:DNA-binding response regulator n=1 Tax=Paenibacillus ginsengarvi TaxID=400777 RepID=A0A3B0CE43_9BACL|nr:response regulator transcription factor [Paenibacillus ginsengarvi]RKN84365.1 DNA-binding response regulator [Paenibacillus ginsengarvi]
MIRLLWIEDEQRLLTEGQSFLQAEGFSVTCAGTVREAEAYLNGQMFDFILLDWMLPDGSGIELCKQIQTRWKTPVMMLTAKTDEFDKVLALEIGADDYLTKPFGMRELLARIKAVLRRMKKWSEPDAAPSPHEWARGDLRIDEHKYTVTKKGDQIPLTRTEFALLLQLAKHPGRVYSRLQLMDEALGDTYIGFERTIDSHIRNLRKKIEDNPVEPQYVLTVFGIGYKFGEGL